MKRIVSKHLYSILVVSLLLLLTVFMLRPAPPAEQKISPEFKQLQELNLNPEDRFQATLFKEMARTLAGKDSSRYLALWKKLTTAKSTGDVISEKEWALRQTYRKPLGQLLWMYIKFILIFLIVMSLTYYGVQTLGLYLFIRHQQMNPPQLYQFFFLLRRWLVTPEWRTYLRLLTSGSVLLGKSLLYFLLFAPAYVVAYSMKTDFTSQSLLFLILLGGLTNGVLITYAYKFYHLLLNESKKGYVRTAIVKNLHNEYRFKGKEGLRWRQVLALKKHFKGHVLQHIYMNSAFQYLPAFKEQAAFVITSLVIIEMALNIHGHLSYELLQQLLYRNFDLALLIVLGLYWLVKGTELFTDLLIFKQQQKLGEA